MSLSSVNPLAYYVGPKNLNMECQGFVERASTELCEAIFSHDLDLEGCPRRLDGDVFEILREVGLAAMSKIFIRLSLKVEDDAKAKGLRVHSHSDHLQRGFLCCCGGRLAESVGKGGCVPLLHNTQVLSLHGFEPDGHDPGRLPV